VDFSRRQTLIVAIPVPVPGRWLNRRFTALREWNNRESVTVGFIAGPVLVLRRLATALFSGILLSNVVPRLIP
jgi:hypothetical protein